MGDFLAAFKRFIAFVSGLSAILTLLALFQPDIRAWLLSHAPVGWALALCLSAIVSVLAGLIASLQKRVRSLTAEASISDQRLLNERLMGWKQGDAFMEWLAYHFYSDRVPTDLNRQIEARGKAWELDDRRFVNASLQTAFDELHEAVDAFFDISVAELWFGNETHYEYLETRVRKGHSEYDEVVVSIVAVRDRLLDALREIFKVAQAERIVIQ
jgi:hypothetical protein